MLITVNGLVTRSYPSGNHDRVIHLLTEDHGRLSVMVKGGSSSRAADAASCTQLFTYGNYELYRGKGGDLYWFRGGSVLAPFYELSSDISRMALATYLCDIASELTLEEADEEESAILLRMLLNSLYVLCKGDKSPAIVKSAFELRSVALMGYCPDLTACARCGETSPENAYLDILNGRLVCADCQTKLNRQFLRGGEEDGGEGRRPVCPVSASVLAALRYIVSASDKRLFSFAMKDAEEERALDRATESFLLNQLEREFDTLRFYRSVAD
jgi:DNA repair protein RecO (recombination protein O)